MVSPDRHDAIQFLLGMVRIAANELERTEPDVTGIELMFAGTKALGELGVSTNELAEVTLNSVGANLNSEDKRLLEEIKLTGKADVHQRIEDLLR